MAFLGMGPYSVSEAREIANLINLPVRIHTAKFLSENLNSCLGSLVRGIPFICLFKENSAGGHFVAFVPRAGGIEIFDPLGSGDDNEALNRYLEVESPEDINGPKGWVREMMKYLRKIGLKSTYNIKGPQYKFAQSCLIWCLLHCAVPDPPPSVFVKKCASL